MILDFHSKSSYKSLLHIESDVICFPNFPWDSFRNLNSLAWPRVDDNQDIASLIFLPDKKQSKWLENELLNLLKTDINFTDMRILNEISKSYPDKIILLPISNLKMPFTIDSNNADFSSFYEIAKHSDFFNGIFDGLHTGVWLTGTDPRNRYGLTIFHDSKLISDSNSLIKPGKFTYEMDSNGCVYLTSNNYTTSLFSLHVHSKNLKLFGPNWINELKIFIENSRMPSKSVHTFSPKLLIDLLYANTKSGTLRSYILGIPLLKNFREFLK